MIRQLLYGALMWAVCLYAFFRGGWAERVTAGGILIATYVTVLVLSPLAIRYQFVELPVMAVDTVLLFVLVGISLKSEKFWPLWLTAMQGLTILSHLAPYVPHVLPWAYGNAVAVWIYPMLIVLGFAVHSHHRSRKAGGSFSG
ncbi:hypothetical protein GG804_10755 [Sphingomonas histidinilytica]|uniref:Uncharacterized protein n=1 Tax=Rhizorhabdus histidinilytica TaxID=439228 RepID=A0A1T5F2E4_9SPHN|nr:hypothetical protein [Rhizorhabdus histidinilytica]MBO9377246.1 hypothetical protein [Rhizorhabdus histidinilytica]SKB90345.1 hypothetical protein SAMN06295920_10860 [Rhizorhabdus histidinilytica]